MTATWTPTPDLLFSHPELYGPVSFVVKVTFATATLPDPEEPDPVTPPTGDGRAVVNYRGWITPAQTVLSVVSGVHGITISAPSLEGLPPIVGVDYLRNGALANVPKWAQFPADATEVVAFHPSRERIYTCYLHAVAELSDETEIEQIYRMAVYRDWTPGANRLRSEIDARRGA